MWNVNQVCSILSVYGQRRNCWVLQCVGQDHFQSSLLRKMIPLLCSWPWVLKEWEPLHGSFCLQVPLDHWAFQIFSTTSYKHFPQKPCCDSSLESILISLAISEHFFQAEAQVHPKTNYLQILAGYEAPESSESTSHKFQETPVSLFCLGV